MSIRRTVGNFIAVLLAFVWTYASQAHLTAKLTPGVANDVNASTGIAHRAYDFSGISVDQLKHFFGTLGLLTAFLLWIPGTRRLGCLAAVVITIAGRIYPQLTVEHDEGGHLGASVVSAFVAVAAGILLS